MFFFFALFSLSLSFFFSCACSLAISSCCPLLLTRLGACPVSARAWFSICDLNQQVSCMAFPLFSRCFSIAFLHSLLLFGLPINVHVIVIVVVVIAFLLFSFGFGWLPTTSCSYSCCFCCCCSPLSALCALVQRCQALTFVISSSPQSVNNAMWIGSSYEQRQSSSSPSSPLSPLSPL